LGKLDETNDRIAGLIILAGFTRRLEDMLLAKTRYVLELNGELSGADEARLGDLSRKVLLAQSPDLSPDTPREKLPWELGARYLLDFNAHSPVALARELPHPMLIAHGARDFETTDEDFESWKAGLADKKDVTFELYPRCNHLFIEGEGQSRPVEYEVNHRVAHYVVDDIAQWMFAVEGS
jgi:hypothetical protein